MWREESTLVSVSQEYEGRVCLPTAFLVDGKAGVLAMDDDPVIQEI